MNKRFFGLSLIISAWLTATSDSDAKTLNDAVQQAVDTHPTVIVAKANYQATREIVDLERSAMYPTIGLRVAGGYEYSDNQATRNRLNRGSKQAHLELWRNEQSFTLSQLLFDGFSVSHRVESAKFRFQGSEYQLMDSAEQLGLKAVEAYLEMLRQMKRLELARTNVDNHQKMLDLTKFRKKAGGGTAADVQQAQVRLNFAKATLLEFEGVQRNAVARYLQVFGEQPSENLIRPLQPKRVDIPADANQTIELALQQSPAYKATISQVEASKADMDASKGAYYPSVFLELSTGRTENLDGVRGKGTDAVAQVILNYTIYDGDNRGAKNREAYARRYESLYRQRETQRLLEEESRVGFNAFVTTKARLAILKTNVENSEQVLDSYRSQFELGKRSLLDLLDAHNELFQAKVSFTDGDYAHLFAHYQLLATTGQLLHYLNVSVDKQNIGE